MGFWETVVATAAGASVPVALGYALRAIREKRRPVSPLEQYMGQLVGRMNEGAAKMIDSKDSY